MTRVLATFGSAALACWLAACSGSDNNDQGTTKDPASSVSKCTNEKRATPYSAGMMETTTSGMKLYLDDSDPSPPALGRNKWTLRVEDASGAPVNDAGLTISPRMPDHNHGSPLNVKVTSNGDGTYGLNPVDFNMDGYWEITISVNSDTDKAMFPLCVE